MDELILKLSEILDISMEAAVDLYPILREQYMWYSISESFRLFGFLTFVAGLVLFSIFIFSVDDLETHPSDLGLEEGDLGYDRKLRRHTREKESLSVLFNRAVRCIVVSLVIYIILTIVKHVFAPDIMLILEFFN